MDHTEPLRAIAVYQTAIQSTYDAAQQSWDDPIHVMMAKRIQGYDVLMTIINLQSADDPVQLRISHCVVALYTAVVRLTDNILFCHLDSDLSVYSERIGTLSIYPAKHHLIDPFSVLTLGQESNVTALDQSSTNLMRRSGILRDDLDPHLSFNYYSYEKPVTPKEVSLVILDALASAAPFDRNAECKELEATSPGGGTAIFMESTTDNLRFTYGNATKTLLRLYQRMIVPLKLWEEIYCEVSYDNQKFGELRMLRMIGAGKEKHVGVDEQ